MNQSSFALTVLAISVIWLGACSKKVAKVVTLPPPSPTAPTATLAASPSVIEQGQSTQLTWKTGNAEAVTIEGLGECWRFGHANGNTRCLDHLHAHVERSRRNPGGLSSDYSQP